MSEKNEAMGLFERTIPISKAVVDIFAKEATIRYAKGKGDAVYISNGYFALKTNQKQFDNLVAQINRRKREADIKPEEMERLLEVVDNVKGKFELTEKPHEMALNKKLTSYFYTDKRYCFHYNKEYADLISNNLTRLFVDDNTSHDIIAHSLVAKNRNNEVLGVVLPMAMSDALYEKLADVLPLEKKWTNGIDRIKENPTNDPYIGKEFFDGKDTRIVSAIRNCGGVDMYLVPRIENGKLSKSADLICI